MSSDVRLPVQNGDEIDLIAWTEHPDDIRDLQSVVHTSERVRLASVSVQTGCSDRRRDEEDEEEKKHGDGSRYDIPMRRELDPCHH